MTYYTSMDSPLGRLLLMSDGEALTGLYMNPLPKLETNGTESETAAPFPEAKQQLAAYFAGERRGFDLPLSPIGTEFQKRVWDELLNIPYGATISYGELARRIGDPKASRAVGLANGRNPISVIIPCHRVIGASGKLTGYGGGLSRKETLLALEGQARLFGP